MEKMIEFLDLGIENKYNVLVDYILISCPTCGSHWGVSLKNRGEQVMYSRDFVCRDCAADKVAGTY